MNVSLMFAEMLVQTMFKCTLICIMLISPLQGQLFCLFLRALCEAERLAEGTFQNETAVELYEA